MKKVITVWMFFFSMTATTWGQTSGSGLIRADGEPDNLIGFHYDTVQPAATYVKRQPDGSWLCDIWIEPGSHGKNITPQQSKAEVDRAWKEISQFCRLYHRFVSNAQTATIKIYVKDNEGMSVWINGKKYYAGGLSWGGGVVWINGERDMGLNRPGRRVWGTLSTHEALHDGRVGGKWSHTNDTDCVMNVGLTSTTFCRYEVLRLQQRYGRPLETWFPVDKQLSAKRFWSLHEVRVQLIKQRDAETDPAKRAAIQKKVLANLDKLIVEHGVFWKWNRYWDGVPMAHVHR